MKGSSRSVKAVLTDIEGTTSSIAFVKEVLFPYSKERLPTFVKERVSDPKVQRILEEVRAISGQSLDLNGVIDILLRWIEEDRKVPPLKELQGMIWEEGYRKGEIEGHIYEDAYERLKEWHEQGYPIYVYSSGSVQAQKLLFSHTPYGDITYLFAGYFDTRMGSKKKESSYRRIAKKIGLDPEEILFLSDNPEEIEAAHRAGLKVIRFAREGENEILQDYPHMQVRSFYEIPDLTEL